MTAERTRRAQFVLGGRQARHIAPAILLGVAAGAACGWNLSFALLLTVALWLNTPMVLLASSCVAGFAVALFCENLATTVGRALLDKCDLGSALYAFAPGPTAALFGLDDYQLVGNLGLGIIVGIPAAHALTRLMCRAPAEDDEPELVPADPLFRPLGFLVATACAGCTVVALQVIGPQLVGRAALERLTAAVGAPVTVDRFDYDLWRGELELTNLRISDARDGRTVFTARRVEGRVEPGMMLRGRLHAEEFAIGGVSFDLSASHRSERALAIYARRPSILKETDEGDPTPGVDPTADVEVQTMLKHVSTTNERLAALAAAIMQVEWIADLEATHTAGGKRLDAFVRRKAAPRDGASGRAAPLVKLKQVRIDGLSDLAELGPGTQVTLANLTSHPSTAARHAQLTLVDEAKFRLQTTFHLADPERQHAVSFELADVAAGDLINAAAVKGFDVREGRVEIIRGNGTATRERFDIRLLVVARGIRAASTTGSIGGVDGELLGAALEKLPTVQVALRADGRWSQPRLSLSPPAVIRDLKSLLRVAGAGDLAIAIEAGNSPTAAGLKAKALAAQAAARSTTSLTTPPPVAAALAPGVSRGGPAAAQLPPGAPTAAGVTSIAATNIAATTAGPAKPPVSAELAKASTGAPVVASPVAASPVAPTPVALTQVAGTAAPTNGLFGQKPTANPSGSKPGSSSTAALNKPTPALPMSVLPASVAGMPPRDGERPSAGPVPAYGSPASQIAVPRTTPDVATTGLKTGADSSTTPFVQRATHTVAQRSTGSTPKGSALPNGATALASDEFSPDGADGAGPVVPGLSTDGLRQPRSVLPPSRLPGPVDLQTGPELESPTSTYGRRPQTERLEPRQPETRQGDPRETESRGPAATPKRYGSTTLFDTPAIAGDELPDPRGLRMSPRGEILPREPVDLRFHGLHPSRYGHSPRPDVATDRELEPATPKPEKKSLFSGITKLFGKPEPVVVEDAPYDEPAPYRYPAEGTQRRTTPAAESFDPAPTTEPEPKSDFPLIRSLFGSKPKPAATPSRSAEEAPKQERGLFGGSKRYDSGKPANAPTKSRGIFGSKTSSVAPSGESDERVYATPSGYTSDDEFRSSEPNRIPTVQYEAPVGGGPRAIPAGGAVPQATDLESPRKPERVSAGLPWYERMIR